MLEARTLSGLREACAALRAGGRGLGLVPTMGALHAGHAALIAAARDAGVAAAASIFVNPLQFAPDEDLARYPRDEAADLHRLAQAGCDLAWLPDAATMYPPGSATYVEVAGPALRWEGERRPGHFRGVASVVARLFGQVRPDLACFGEKDWQQLQVVRRMVQDLHLPVRIIGVPTLREPDGLALSSRNRFLSPAERRTAPLLSAVLAEAAAALARGEPVDPMLDLAGARLGAAGFAVEYLALVDGTGLEPAATPEPGARLIAAARLGPVRLIDNVGVCAKEEGQGLRPLDPRWGRAPDPFT
ncbi:MAG: pantoate--beta-alanine ligase [Acidisphaera sp.]|nr:pantoate--beta-alanine ligase [Acidisphaera sp.]